MENRKNARLHRGSAATVDPQDDPTAAAAAPPSQAPPSGSDGAGTPVGEATDAIEEARQRLEKAARAVAQRSRDGTLSLHDAFLDERNDVMQVINELEEQLDRHQEIRQRLEAELKTANERLQAAQQRTQELEWQIVTLQTRVEALEQARQEVALLEDELANATTQIQRLTQEQAYGEKERARLRNELKAANKQLEELWALRKERDGLRADIKNLTARLEALDRNQRDLIDERALLSSKLQETTAALEEARSERHRHQVLLRAAEDRANELLRVQEELTDKIEALRAEKKNLQAQIAQLERENARLIEQRQFYETELASIRNSNRNAEAALASVKKAFAEIRVALTETKSRARRRLIEAWPRFDVPTAAPETPSQTAANVSHVEALDAGELAASQPATAVSPAAQV